MTRELAYAALLMASTSLYGQTSPHAASGQSQSVGTNNGVVIQTNITVAPAVKKRLGEAAKRDFIDARGWMRTLLPANDIIDEQRCDGIPGFTSPREALILQAGGGMASTCEQEKCVVIKDGSSGAEVPELLTLHRKGKSVALDANIFDDHGVLIAALDANRPEINQHNALDWDRPDEHTLTVTDQKKRRVLYVRFENPRTMYIEGIFYNSLGRKITITKEQADLYLPDGRQLSTFRGGCFANPATAISF
jgi:hypothetical protein